MNSGNSKRAWGGFLVRKERWGFSLWGWVVTGLMGLVVIVALARGLYPFLAITSRTSNELLVVEGWINSDSIEQAAREYHRVNYQDVLVVALVYKVGNKWDSGRYKTEYISEAMIRSGIPREHIHVVHCDVVKKDRTYAAALAVQQWIRGQKKKINSMDIVTLGSHARRSRLLFEKAFPSHIKIGVIAMDERDFDPVHWWRSSEGVREVLFEGVAYLYTRFFFSQPQSTNDL